MDKENIKRYICDHSERTLTQKKLKLVPLALLCMLFFGSGFSVLSGNSVYMWILLVLLLPYGAWFVVRMKGRDNTYAERLLLHGSLMPIFSIFFLLFSFAFVDRLGRNIVAHKFFISLSLFLFLTVYYAITANSIKKYGYSQRPTIPTVAAPLAGIAVLGMSLARVIFAGMSQETSEEVCIFISAILSMGCLLRTDNLLKYYLCKKYKIDLE